MGFKGSVGGTVAALTFPLKKTAKELAHHIASAVEVSDSTCIGARYLGPVFRRAERRVATATLGWALGNRMAWKVGSRAIPIAGWALLVWDAVEIGSYIDDAADAAWEEILARDR
jgi:hypothetical protein